MILGRRVPIVLLAVAVACVVAAVALIWGGSSLQAQANLFGAGINLDPDNQQQFTEEQYRYMNSLYMNADALLDLVAPMAIAGMAAAFAALSLLGVRWEALRRVRLRQRDVQAEAPAAS